MRSSLLSTKKRVSLRQRQTRVVADPDSPA
jgi:hypothetical protein